MEPTQKFSLYEYLTRKDSVFDKYANVKRFVKLDGGSWLTLIENNAYGLVYRSVVVRTGGGRGKIMGRVAHELGAGGKVQVVCAYSQVFCYEYNV